MHEASLVSALLKQVDQVLDDHDAPQAASIEVEIGPLSGVEIELVRLAFDRLVKASRSAGATLVINRSPLVIACLDCNSESELPDFTFRCGNCGSGRVQVVQGDQFRLLSVTVKETVDA